MSIQLSHEQALAALKGITIPPRPAILQELERLLQKDSTDARMVADRIARDVALAGAVLKTVNSPLFGLKSRCASVPQAVQMLGLRNVSSLVKGLALRQFLGQSAGAMSLERFWDSAEVVATLAAHIAGLLPRVVREDAYAFGLFRDAGIPLLMQRWPEYRKTLQEAAGDPRPLTVVEEERHGTHHAVMGYLLARAWGLPEPLCDAIQHHHDRNIFDRDQNVAGSVVTLIAINRLAEHLHDNVRRMRAEPEWELMGAKVLDYLGISEGEYRDLSEEVMEIAG